MNGYKRLEEVLAAARAVYRDGRQPDWSAVEAAARVAMPQHMRHPSTRHRVNVALARRVAGRPPVRWC